MVDGDTEQEIDFRQRYSEELRKKRVEGSLNSQFGVNELYEELKKVKQQELLTPGRRGEQIKLEEINKEILRRMSVRTATKQ